MQNTMQPFGEGNGTPLQYSCLEKPMDGGAWWAALHGVAKSRTRLSDFPFPFFCHRHLYSLLKKKKKTSISPNFKRLVNILLKASIKWMYQFL